MKIPPDRYAEIQKAIQMAKEHLQNADRIEKIINDLRQKSIKMQEKYNRKHLEYAELTNEPAKIDILREAKIEAQKQYLTNSMELEIMKKHFSDRYVEIFREEKNVAKLAQKAKIATEKYNQFAAQQAAAQKAFEELNKI